MLSSACRRIAELIRGPSGRPSSTDEAAKQAEDTGGAVSSGSSSSVEKPAPPRTRARTAQSAAGNAPAAGAAAKKRGRRAANEEAPVVCSAPGGSGSGSAKRRPSKKAKVKSKEAPGEAGKGESKEQMMQRLCRDFEAMCRGTTSETICLDGNSFRLSKVLACTMRSGAPRTLLRHAPLPHPVLHRQELGAGADSLVFAGECVAGKFQGRAVVVKLQPRHSSTKYQVVFTPCTSNRRWPQKFPWHVCARFCLDVRACVRACAFKSAGLSQTVSARCQYR